jgi:hypothetical protein
MVNQGKRARAPESWTAALPAMVFMDGKMQWW